jgi:hypothetical protein
MIGCFIGKTAPIVSYIKNLMIYFPLKPWTIGKTINVSRPCKFSEGMLPSGSPEKIKQYVGRGTNSKNFR